MHVLIPILFQDGQSISGSCHTLTNSKEEGRGDRMVFESDIERLVQCACAHPCTVPGWSEYLGILRYFDRGEQCACAHPCTVPGWSKYPGILTGG